MPDIDTDIAIEEYDDWDSLVDAVQQECKKILDEHVAPIAIEIVRGHIKTDIYDAYTPKENGWVSKTGSRETYQRRYLLMSQNSVYHTSVSDDEIMITSRVTASPAVVKGRSFRNRYPGAFLKLLESGNMGIWRGGFPRPAIGNAQKEIDNSKQIASVIQEQLQQ